MTDLFEMYKFGFLCLMVCWTTNIVAEDKMVSYQGITVKVLEQSGKICIYQGTNDSNAVEISYEYLREIDNSGNIINGTVQHSFGDFASTTFTFTEPENSTYGFNNVSVTQFSFSTNIDIEGQAVTLLSYIYVFTENGTISVDGSDVSVTSADVKFNTRIENWPFCGTNGVTCQNEDQTSLTGQYLDFGVEMKGKNEEDPELQAGSTMIYSLGSDTTVLIPSQVTYDGNTTKAMPANYPQVATSDDMKVFVFRFEVFTTSAMYDPIISMEMEEMDMDDVVTESPDTTSAPVMATMSESNVEVDIMKKSGKIILKSGTNEMTVEFKGLTEVMDNGDAILTAGHNIQAFADQDFDVGSMVEETLGGIAVKKIGYTAMLSNSANFNVHVYIFKEGGNLTAGNETIMVSTGAVKFSVEITSWSFCGDAGVTCTNDGTDEVGSHLDFEIVVTGTSEPTEQSVEENEGMKYDLGSGVITFMTKYMKDADSTYIAMPSGYPAYSKQDNKQCFTMRFEKFTTSLVYDPVIKMDTDGNGSDDINASLLSLVLLTLVHVAMKLIVYN